MFHVIRITNQETDMHEMTQSYFYFIPILFL